MTASASKGRKIAGRNTLVASLLAASVVGAAFTPSAASARDHHYGAYAAAGFGGLLLGSVLAANAYQPREVYYDRRCWTERRRVHNAYGETFYRRIRVCD